MDRIVHAMVVAALDKVVKRYIATEFLHDYLKEKKSVGGAEHPAGRRARDRVLGKRAGVSIEPWMYAAPSSTSFISKT